MQYLLSRAVRRTEIPLTMTTSEGCSVENMFARRRFIVSSLQAGNSHNCLYKYICTISNKYVHILKPIEGMSIQKCVYEINVLAVKSILLYAHKSI